MPEEMDTPLAERMLRAFLTQMIRAEAVDPDDIVEAADRLEREGDEEAAHALKLLIVEASAPDLSDWNAERARARFHVVEGESNGGKKCPECGYAFRGNGWDGIDAHWKSKHEHIMPYADAWPLLKAGTYAATDDGKPAA